MKFTAEFDSVNSADMAAAAIRKNISSFSDIRVIEGNSRKKLADKVNFMMFGAYNGSQIYPPVYSSRILSDDFTENNETDLRSRVTLEVVCRSEDKKNVSRLIVGYGGRDLNINS